MDVMRETRSSGLCLRMWVGMGSRIELLLGESCISWSTSLSDTREKEDNMGPSWTGCEGKSLHLESSSSRICLILSEKKSLKRWARSLAGIVVGKGFSVGLPMSSLVTEKNCLLEPAADSIRAHFPVEFRLLA